MTCTPRQSRPLGIALAIALAATSCGRSRGPAGAQAPSTPRVLTTSPEADTFGAPIDGGVSVRFSEPMAAGSLTTATFLVTSGATAVQVPVPGRVITRGATATFEPARPLALDTLFTATITVGASSAAGVPLALDYEWSFTTVAAETPASAGSTRASSSP